MAFDIYWLNGKDVRTTPLIERKRILRKLVPTGSPILYADYIDRNGTELFRAVFEMDLEGIVATSFQGERRLDLFQKRAA